MTDKVSVKRIVDAPLERTWQAWTVADELKQWFSSRTKNLKVIAFDLKPGGKVRLQSLGSVGEYTWTYIKIDKPHELVFDILDFSLPQYPDGIGGICHVNFKAIGDKTEVTVWGEVPNESLRDGYQELFNGWNGTLNNLNKFLTKGDLILLKQITKGVWVHESACLQSNAIIVEGNGGVLLVDAGLTSDEMASIADDLDTLGQTVAVGFSTHPHWDHVLWHARFGKAPRYGTATAVAQMQTTLSNPNWKEEEAADLPEEIAGQVPLDDLFGQITELPTEATYLPWDGPKVKVIEHSGHAPGHAALFVEESKVLIAGDMLSDVFIPMLNLATADPIKDYLAALELFKGLAGDAEFVIPGHGSVGKGDAIRARIDQDRTYVEALRDGTDVNDPRITSPKKGWEWVAGIHGWQAQTIAQK